MSTPIIINPDIPRIFHEEISWKIKNTVSENKVKKAMREYFIIAISDGSRIEVKLKNDSILASPMVIES